MPPSWLALRQLTEGVQRGDLPEFLEGAPSSVDILAKLIGNDRAKRRYRWLHTFSSIQDVSYVMTRVESGLCAMLFLLSLAFPLAVHAQAQQTLSLNSLDSFSAQTSLLGLPPSPQLTVSVAICTSEASSARFFLSNSSSGAVPGPSGGTDVFEIQLSDGTGQWLGSAPSGGLLSVQDLSQGSFQVSVSDNGIPEHSSGVPSC